MGRSSPVCLVHLVSLVYLVQPNNETDQRNQRVQPVLARHAEQFETQNPCLQSILGDLRRALGGH
jgi:hypothetical protein